MAQMHRCSDDETLAAYLDGLLPPDAPPGPSLLTGGELAAWRKHKGWTQEDAASALGVSRYTIMRAEASPESPLKHSIHHALVKLRQQS